MFHGSEDLQWKKNVKLNLLHSKIPQATKVKHRVTDATGRAQTVVDENFLLLFILSTFVSSNVTSEALQFVSPYHPALSARTPPIRTPSNGPIGVPCKLAF